MKATKKKEDGAKKAPTTPKTPGKAGGGGDGGKGSGSFSTFDASFCLTRSQLEAPIGTNATHMYNGQPTSFTNLQSNSLNLDPNRAAMLKRSNFLPYDGVLYELNDAPIEQEALWSFGYKTHLTYNEYLKEIRDQRRMQLQHIVVKQQTGKTFDYSKSPHRPLLDFFSSLSIRRAPRLKLRVPATLVLLDNVRSLYYTDASGLVQRLVGDLCDDQAIQEAFRLSSAPPPPPKADDDAAPKKREKPVAVMKRAGAGKNELTLLDSAEIFKMLRDPSVGNAVIQQFVLPKGSHPAMYRTTWRRNMASSTVLISGHRPMGENNIWHTSSTLIDANTILSFRGISATETQHIVAGIVLHIEKHGPPCQFSEATCDFIKGEDGKMQFLQMKCFVCQSI